MPQTHKHEPYCRPAPRRRGPTARHGNVVEVEFGYRRAPSNPFFVAYFAFLFALWRVTWTKL